MIEFTVRHIWNAMNNLYQVSVGSESLSLMTILVGVHIFLAFVTLGLGDRTVCDVLRPLLKIFKPDAESILDGAIEVTVAVPRAIVYYLTLYVRSYFLAIRVTLCLLFASFAALAVPLAVMIVMGLIEGFNSTIDLVDPFAHLLTIAYYAALGYFFWRFDGKRLATNFRNAWNC